MYFLPSTFVSTCLPFIIFPLISCTHLLNPVPASPSTRLQTPMLSYKDKDGGTYRSEQLGKAGDSKKNRCYGMSDI